MEKTCTKCGETKPLSEFHKQKSGKYGVRSYCKACARIYYPPPEKVKASGAEYRRNNPEKVKASGAEYRRNNPEKVEAGRAKWRRNNPEKVKAAQARAQAKWRRNNPEKVKAAKKKYVKAHPEKAAARAKRWQRNNPHVVWTITYRTRCRQFGFDPDVIEPFTREDVIAEYGDACVYCDGGAFEHLDHYIPVAAHGPHTLENVRPACGVCNVRKSNTTDRVLIDVYRTVAGALAARFAA